MSTLRSQSIINIVPTSPISYDTDIEADTNTEITIDVRQPELTDYSLCETMFSIKVLVSITILYIPIVILNMYFCYNDKSCILNKDISISLQTYLFIDSIYGIGLVMFLPIVLYIIDLDNKIERQMFCFVSLVRTIFILTWTTVGSYIFWGLTDNTECNQNIYYYIYSSLIIRYMFGILFIGLDIEHI